MIGEWLKLNTITGITSHKVTQKLLVEITEKSTFANNDKFHCGIKSNEKINKNYDFRTAIKIEMADINTKEV